MDPLRELAQRIRSAHRLTIMTGAGVSAASGVPTFRGADGLWRNYRSQGLATAAAFRRDPALVWEWYHWRRERIAACEPNAAHQVIAQWSRREACRVITQNVDDLHVRAGTSHLVRLHGSIWEMQCWDRCGHPSWRDERVRPTMSPGLHPPLHSDQVTGDMASLPCCPSCGGLARPAVIWFGESLDPADVTAASAACDCDVFLTIGTSAIVYPAAGLVHAAAAHGAFTAEINRDETPATESVALAVHGPAEQLLPALATLM